MKKLLIATCILSLGFASASMAAQQTNVEKYVSKKIAPVVQKENELTAKRDAQKAKVQQQKTKLEAQKAAQKKAQQEAKAKQQKKIQQKKDALNTLKSW